MRTARFLLTLTTAVLALSAPPVASAPAASRENESNDLCLTLHNSLAAFPGLPPFTCFNLLDEVKIAEIKKMPLTPELHLLKNKINSKIITHHLPKKVGNELRDQLITLLLQMYQHNHLDKCKLIEMLEWEGFHFVIVSEVQLHHVSGIEGAGTSPSHEKMAFYKNTDKSVYIPLELFDFEDILMNMLSHELTHGFDAYSNEKARILFEKEKRYSPAHFFGTSKNVVGNQDDHILQEEDTQDSYRVSQLLNYDRGAVSYMHDLILDVIEKKSISADQQKLVDTYIYLVKAYGYKPEPHLIRLSFGKAESIEKLKQDYVLREGYYRLKPQREGLQLGGVSVDKVSVLSNQRSLYYALKPLTAIEGENADLLLGLDLLRNLLDLYRLADGYKPLHFPSEFHAYTDQLFAPYSTPKQGLPTLVEWLLPNYFKHLGTRATESYMRCVKQY